MRAIAQATTEPHSDRLIPPATRRPSRYAARAQPAVFASVDDAHASERLGCHVNPDVAAHSLGFGPGHRAAIPRRPGAILARSSGLIPDVLDDRRARAGEGIGQRGVSQHSCRSDPTPVQCDRRDRCRPPTYPSRLLERRLPPSRHSPAQVAIRRRRSVRPPPQIQQERSRDLRRCARAADGAARDPAHLARIVSKDVRPVLDAIARAAQKPTTRQRRGGLQRLTAARVHLPPSRGTAKSRIDAADVSAATRPRDGGDPGHSWQGEVVASPGRARRSCLRALTPTRLPVGFAACWRFL